MLELPNIWGLIAPEEVATIKARMERRYKGETVAPQYEYPALKRDGTRIWGDQRITLIDWEGGPASLVTAVDITDRKRTEAELKRRDAILTAISEAASRVLSEGDWRAPVEALLERLGRENGASRS